MRYTKFIFQLLLTPFLWVGYLLSGFFSRSGKKILFGTHTSMPAGNILAFYNDVIYSLGNEYQVIWIVNSNEALSRYEKSGLLAINKYTYKGIVLCLTSRYYCFSQHINDISFALSRKTKKINLWHGTPIKKIERDIDTGIYALRYKYQFIFKLIQPWIYNKFDKIFCACQHDCNVFTSAFNIDKDKFYKTFSPRLLPLKNIYFQENKVILIAPTFRDNGRFDYNLVFDFLELSKLGEAFGCEVKIKLHPADKSIIKIPSAIKNVSLVDKDVNFYDLMAEAKIIITDYSSVFYDAFSLNLPVIFYWPDYDDFLSESRDFYLNMADLYPELICYDFYSLNKLVQSTLLHPKKIESKLFEPYNKSHGYPSEIFKL